VSSGISGLLMGAIPLLMMVAAHIFIAEERLTVTKAIGFIFGFIGIIVLMSPKASLSASFSGSALIGELAILLGCLCYVTHSISAKRLGFHDPVLQTAAVCLAGAVIGVVFALAWAPINPASIPSSALWPVVGLGLLPTALASLVMYRLIERTGPSFVSFSNYLVPVYALLFGAVMLHEQLSWNVLAALAFILAGIAISRRKIKTTSP
jgi:drug/metabolite transporter (DMT)-like permease